MHRSVDQAIYPWTGPGSENVTRVTPTPVEECLFAGSTSIQTSNGDTSRRQVARLCQRSGITPGPTVQDETADNSDDSPADGTERDHADQQECEHHEGCAALPVAVSPCDHDSRNAD
jgi:hypothetical protein